MQEVEFIGAGSEHRPNHWIGGGGGGDLPWVMLFFYWNTVFPNIPNVAPFPLLYINLGNRVWACSNTFMCPVNTHKGECNRPAQIPNESIWEICDLHWSALFRSCFRIGRPISKHWLKYCLWKPEHVIIEMMKLEVWPDEIYCYAL
jgi:hypothetical protein